MLASLSVIVSLAVLPFVSAQDVDDAPAIKAIEAHFEQSHITEDYLDDFDPIATLDLNFPGVGDVTPGQRLSAAQAGPQPIVTVTPGDSSVTLNGTFTIAMFDINTVGEDLPNGPTRHWLLNGVTLDGNTVSNATATPITAYAGPGPAAGSGAHRYIVALYQQPANFAAPEGFQEPTGVEPMNFKAYVENANLELVAANYIIVEEGTATASAVSTEAVNSATLGGAAGSSGSSGAGRPTGSSSGGAPQPSEEGSAAKISAFGASAVALVGGLAVLAL